MTKKTVGLIISILLIATMVVLMVKSTIDEKKPIENAEELGGEIGLKQGDTPPDFELQTLAGDTVKLSDYKGQKVILNFWASWCGPCKAEMPHMEKFYEDNKDTENVEIIAVNLTAAERKGLKGIEEFIDSYGLTFPIPLDKDGEIGEVYEVMTIPTSYIIGTDGKLTQVITGPMNEEMMKDLVNNSN